MRPARYWRNGAHARRASGCQQRPGHLLNSFEDVAALNDHKRRIDSRDIEIYRLDEKIDRLEALANRESLAAGYLSGMAT